MTKYDEKLTINQILRQKTGQIQVKPGQLGVVAQDGRFGHFLPSGWHPPLNRWNEQLVMYFSIIARTVEATEKMMAADGQTFIASISVRYTFDPSKADNDHLGEMANIAMGQSAERLLREKVTRAALYGLRNQINLFNSNELMRGQIYTQLEKGVRCYLLRAFTGLGIMMEGSDSIIVKSLEPSPELMEEIRLQKLAELTPTLPQALWPGLLHQQDEVIHHTITSWPNQPVSREPAMADIQTIIPLKPVSHGDLHHHAN